MVYKRIPILFVWPGLVFTQSNEWCSIGFHCRTVPLDAPEICHNSNYALLYKLLSVIFVNITISEKINFVLFTLRCLFKCYKRYFCHFFLSKSVFTHIVKAYKSTYLQQIMIKIINFKESQ